MRAWLGWRVATLVGLLAWLVASLAVAQTQAEEYALGIRLFQQERYVEALPYFEQAREDAARQYGEQSAEHAIELNNLAELYRRLERYDEAELLFLQALAIDESRLGADDPGLATTMNNLGLLYRAQGRYGEAERYLERSLAALEKSLGRRHPDVARSLNNLAMLYQATGRVENALPLLERAVEISRDLLGEAHPTTKRLVQNRQEVVAAMAAQPAENDPDTAAILSDGQSIAAEQAPPTDLTSGGLVVPDASTRARVLEGASEAAAPGGAEGATPTSVGAQFGPIEPRPAPAEGSAPAVSPLAEQWATFEPGDFAMHLASVRSPTAATEEWARIAEQLDLSPQIRQIEPQRIEISDKGVFYRVMGGPFDSAAAVEQACRAVKNTGQYCAIVAHDG